MVDTTWPERVWRMGPTMPAQSLLRPKDATVFMARSGTEGSYGAGLGGAGNAPFGPVRPDRVFTGHEVEHRCTSNSGKQRQNGGIERKATRNDHDNWMATLHRYANK